MICFKVIVVVSIIRKKVCNCNCIYYIFFEYRAQLCIYTQLYIIYIYIYIYIYKTSYNLEVIGDLAITEVIIRGLASSVYLGMVL